MIESNEYNIDELFEAYFDDNGVQQQKQLEFEHQLNQEHEMFLIQNESVVTVNPFNPWDAVSAIVDVKDESIFLKNLKPNEVSIALSQANSGNLGLRGTTINEDGSKTCLGNFITKHENILSHKAYDLQRLVNSSCVSAPNNGFGGFGSGSLLFNIGSFEKDQDVQILFKYLYKLAFEWDMNPNRQAYVLFRASLDIKLHQIHSNSGSRRTINGAIFEKHEIKRQLVVNPLQGNKIMSPKVKTKAEKFKVTKSDKNNPHYYVVEISGGVYNWPVNGNTLCKQSFELIPYS